VLSQMPLPTRERCVSGRCGTRWIQWQAPTSPQAADQGKRDLM
jgi:hypothetical protein